MNYYEMKRRMEEGFFNQDLEDQNENKSRENGE